MKKFFRITLNTLLLATSFNFTHAQVGWSGASQIENASTVIGSGDFNNDGAIDLAFQQSDFYWYEGPNFTTRHLIGDGDGQCYGATAIDINGDGWTDWVASDGARSSGPGALWVFLHPGSAAAATSTWTRIEVYDIDVWHQNDLEVADMDNDGRLDIVVRTRSPQNRLVVALQNANINTWTVRTFSTGETSNAPEGIGIGDIDGDTYNDIVLSGVYWSNAGGWRTGDPSEHIIDSEFVNAAIKADVADIDGDGDNDVAISKAEGNATKYVALYENTGNPTGGEGAWPRTILFDESTKVHTLEFADMDMDGDLDLVAGQSFSETSIRIYYNTGSIGDWPEEIINGKLYVVTITDLDADGDPDLAGPTKFGGPVVYHLNQLVENGGGGDPSAPDAPTSLIATAQSEGSISLVWSDNASNEGAYLIERKTGAGDFQSISTQSANTTVYIDTDLSSNTIYTYRVFAQNATGDSAYSNEASATTLAPDETAPSIPGGLIQDAITFSSVEISWNPATDNVGVTNYRILRDGNFLADSTDTAYTDSTLAELSTYAYTIEAEDAAGNRSAASDPLQVTTPEAPNLDVDLLGYWNLDAASGTVISDLTSNQDGTLAADPGTPTWLPEGGWLEGGLSFDGSDDRAALGTLDVPSNLETFSIAVWAKFDSFGQKEARLLSKTDGSSGNDHYWMVSTINNDGLRFRLKTENGGTTTLVTDADVLSLDTWHHITMTYDGQTMRIYLDGIELADTNKTGAVSQDATVPVAIGNQPPGAGERPFHGVIDELRLYKRALSTADIGLLMTLPAAPEPTPLETWLEDKFTEAELSDPLISGYGADPDFDSIPNLVEYAFKLEPFTADASGPVSLTFESGGSARILLDRHTDITDVVIEIMASSTLESTDWQVIARSTAAGPFQAVAGGFLSEGTESNSVISVEIGDAPSFLDAAQRFFRISILPIE